MIRAYIRMIAAGKSAEGRPNRSVVRIIGNTQHLVIVHGHTVPAKVLINYNPRPNYPSRPALCGLCGSVLTARPGLRGIGAAIHGMAEKIRLRLLRLRRYGHLCQPAIYGGSRSRSACGNTKGSHRAQPHPCLAEPIHLTYQRMRTWAVGNHQGDAKR